MKNAVRDFLTQELDVPSMSPFFCGSALVKASGDSDLN